MWNNNVIFLFVNIVMNIEDGKSRDSGNNYEEEEHVELVQ